MFRNETQDWMYRTVMRAERSRRITAASDLLGRATAWAVFRATGVRS